MTTRSDTVASYALRPDGPRVTAVSCMRNEGAFLLDWIAHHLVVGVTHFVVMSNDCEDGTDLMLDRLSDLGLVTHIRNDGPYDKNGIQFTGLKLADKTEAVRKADWLISMDVDEFINIHAGDRSISALLDALPEATAIPLTWRIFGNNGVVHFEDRPVPHQFTTAAPTLLTWPWRAAMFKTLYRNDKTYGNFGVHRPRNPRDPRIEQARWFDGEGRELPKIYHTEKIFSPFGRSNFALAQLNHYPLGAMESYLLKVDRGRVNRTSRLGMDYWVDRNFHQEEDLSIRMLDPTVAKQRAAFSTDPILSQHHQTSVAWRRARLETLLREEPYRALMARLHMTPPTQVLSADNAANLFHWAKLTRK